MITNEWNQHYKPNISTSSEDMDSANSTSQLVEDLFSQQMKSQNLQTKSEIDRYLTSPVANANDTAGGPVKWWMVR